MEVVFKATLEAARHMVAEVAHLMAEVDHHSEVAVEAAIEAVEDKEVEEETRMPPFSLETWLIHALIGN